MFSDYPGQDVYGSVCRGWTEALPKEGKCFEVIHRSRAQGRSEGLPRATERGGSRDASAAVIFSHFVEILHKLFSFFFFLPETAIGWSAWLRSVGSAIRCFPLFHA